MKRLPAQVLSSLFLLLNVSQAQIPVPGSVKWTYGVPSDDFHSCPAIGPDGSIYAGSWNSKMVALNQDGSLKWERIVGWPIREPVSLASNGTLYISAHHELIAMRTDGSFKWGFIIQDGKKLTSPSIGPDGTVYVGSEDGHLHAVHPSGSVKWSFPTCGPVVHSPSIGIEGTIFVASADTLYAMKPDGTRKWAFGTVNPISGIPALTDEGVTYVATGLGELFPNNVEAYFFAVNYSGQQLWRKNTIQGVRFTNSPVVAPDGSVCIGSLYGAFAIYNPDGTYKKGWMLNQSSAPATSTPAIGLDGTIYIGSGNTQLSANPQPSGTGWYYYDMSMNSASPTLADDGSVIVAHGAISAMDNEGSGLAHGRWVKSKANIRNTGSLLDDADPGEDPVLDPRIVWRFDTDSNIQWSSPALGSDGTVYIGSAEGSLHGVNPDGTPQWAYRTHGAIIASPAVGPDSTVYVGSTDSLLHAVNTDGTVKWTYRAGGQIISTPAVSLDGTVYAGSLDHRLHAINGNGSPKWTFETGATVYSSPVIGRDSTIFFGADDKNFYALRPDGSEKWRFTAGGGIGTSAAIDTDGTVYFGCGDNRVYAVNADGSEKWHYTASWNIWSSPAIAPDGTILVGLRENKLLALNRDGTEKWTLDVPGQIWSSPLVGADNRIYVGCHDAGVYAVTMEGAVEWTVYTGGEVWSSPAMSSDGILYVGSRDGWVYAIRTESGGLADAPWPKFRHDTRNSGSVQAAGEEEPPVNPPEPGDILWTYGDAGNGFISCPAVGPDGTIYAGSADSMLVALNPDGTEKWTKKLDRAVLEPVALAADGTVYGAASDMLFAVDPAGTLKWMLNGEAGKKYTSPSIGPDGDLYVGSEDGRVSRLAAGTSFDDLPESMEPASVGPKWSFFTGSPVIYAPVIGTGGTVYAASGDTLFALRRDGSLKWKFGTLSKITGVPGLGADGTVYVGVAKYFRGNPIGEDGALFAVDVDGKMRWHRVVPYAWVANSPVVDADGAVYFGDGIGGMTVLNPDGSDRTGHLMNNSLGPVQSTPAIGSDGRIYVGDGNNFYYALNLDLEPVSWYILAPIASSSPALTPDSTVIIQHGGQLKAIFSGRSGLGDGPWAKTKGNPGNTGCLLKEGSPVAIAASNRLQTNPGVPITLDGSDSFSPNPGPMTYSWQCLEKPEGASVVITTPENASATVRLSTHGIYRFRLTVSDGSGASSSDFVKIHCGLKWTAFVGSAPVGNEMGDAFSYHFHSSPAVGTDGTVYVGSPWFGNGLHALHPDGSLRWSVGFGETDNETDPVLLEDGSVYFKGKTVSPDGTVKWTAEGYADRNWKRVTPATHDNALFFGYFCLLDDGSMNWNMANDGFEAVSDPAIGSFGVVTFGAERTSPGEGSVLISIYGDGNPAWEFSEGRDFTSAAIDRYGRLYIGAGDSLLALHGNTLLWAYPVEGASFVDPVLGPGGVIYCGSGDGRMFAVNPDGSTAWVFQTDGPISSSAAVDSDGRIYFGSGDSRFYSLNPDGTLHWSYPIHGADGCSAPAIAQDGTVLVGWNDGNLYAFHTGSAGLADSDWPKLHHDNRNTGFITVWDGVEYPEENSAFMTAPLRFTLLPNHPNPFNPETTIGFGLPRASDVRLEIYNALGQRVRILLEGRKNAGWHSVVWDGRDGTGAAVLSGIYVVRIQAGRFTVSRKMMLMK